MPWISCKFELELKWTKYYVFSAAGNDNANDNLNRHKTICPCRHFINKRKPKLSKLLSKGFEDQFVGMNIYKKKHGNKITKNEYRYFLESNFVGVYRFFVLVYSNQDENCKRFRTLKYYLPKGIIDNYSVIINGKNFHDQPIDSDIKQYEEIRKLTAGQGEYYTTGCLLDLDYIKNYCRLIAVDLSRQK